MKILAFLLVFCFSNLSLFSQQEPTLDPYANYLMTYDISWSPNGEIIASVSAVEKDRRTGLYLWDGTTAENLNIFNETYINTDNVSWSPDSRQIALGGGLDGFGRIWIFDNNGDGLFKTIEVGVHVHEVTWLNNQEIFISLDDGDPIQTIPKSTLPEIVRISIETEEEVSRFPSPRNIAQSFWIDEQFLVVGEIYEDGYHIWDYDFMQEVASQRYDEIQTEAGYSPTTDTIAISLSREAKVLILNAFEGNMLGEISHDDLLSEYPAEQREQLKGLVSTQVEFNKDGTKLAIFDGYSMVSIYDVETLSLLHRFKNTGHFTWHPFDDRIAIFVGDMRDTLIIYNAATGEQLASSQ